MTGFGFDPDDIELPPPPSDEDAPPQEATLEDQLRASVEMTAPADQYLDPSYPESAVDDELRSLGVDPNALRPPCPSRWCSKPSGHDDECDEELSPSCPATVSGEPAGGQSDRGATLCPSAKVPREESAGQPFTLDPIQQQAVELACTPCTAPGPAVITGWPGTGKSSVVRYVLDRLDQQRRTCELAAPTGKAARRLQETTGRPARTIHRLLEYNPSLGGFQRTHVNPLEADVVVIDEASMVDVELMGYLCSAIDPRRTRLVLVGDADQLPSVGPGRVLADLVGDEDNPPLVPVVRLQTLHRSAAQSWVHVNAPVILAGKMPDLADRADFRFLEVEDAADIARVVQQLVTEWLPQHTGGAEAQVLSPQKTGKAGILALNCTLQDALNPARKGDRKLLRGDYELRAGDRVIQTKNNYTLEVFNGEVGDVVSVDGKGCVVNFGDRELEYSLEQADALQLAYALTVHRCVSPDTMVETPQGLMMIAELQENGDIATADGARQFDSLVSNPPREILRIETEDGYRIDVTPEHGMMAWDGAQYARIDARDLKHGQFLRLRLGATCASSEAPPLPPSPKTLDVRARRFDIPPRLTVEAAEFLGLMVADGTVYRRGFRLKKRHADVAERFSDLCSTLFGCDAKQIFKRNMHCAEICSTMLASWLLGIDGLAPNKKAIPRVVLRAPLRQQFAFLRGLFEDGTVNVRGAVRDERIDHIEWSTCYKDMARTVQVMLLRAGIVSNRKYRDGQHVIYVYGQHAKRFGELIGFVSQFKQSRLAFPAGNETRYVIPVAHGRCYPQDRNSNNRGYVSRHKAKELDGFGEELRFHHSRIRHIEKTVGPSMCVRVPGYGRFLQNGFDGCNSQGSEFPWVVVVCHSTHTHMLTRQLFYTAVTRAKQGVVIVGNKKGLGVATSDREPPKRNTGLVERMRGEI